MQKVANRRRTHQCQNNLKQWALAMHNYHGAKGTLPFGGRNRNADGSTTTTKGMRNSWIPLLWPYIEQNALFGAYDIDENFTLDSGSIKNKTLTRTQIALYVCPADVAIGATGGVNSRVRGNYAVNWGPVEYRKASGTPAAVAPFGWIDYQSENKPRQTKLREFQDGTSNTLLMSETLAMPGAVDNDWRGDIFNEQGNSMFMTVTPPNSQAFDTARSPYCTSMPEIGLGCTLLGTSNRNYYFAARSRHDSGVNVAPRRRRGPLRRHGDRARDVERAQHHE